MNAPFDNFFSIDCTFFVFTLGRLVKPSNAGLQFISQNPPHAHF
jgi:hypothetical protein